MVDIAPCSEDSIWIDSETPSFFWLLYLVIYCNAGLSHLAMTVGTLQSFKYMAMILAAAPGVLAEAARMTLGTFNSTPATSRPPGTITARAMQIAVVVTTALIVAPGFA